MSAANEAFDDAREALSALMEGSLSPAQQIDLEERIQRDPVVCAEWVAMLRQDVLLGEVLAEEKFMRTPARKSTATSVPARSASIPVPKSPAPVPISAARVPMGKKYWFAASAAGLMLGVFGWLLLSKMTRPTESSDQAVISLLTGEVLIERMGTSQPATEGMTLRSGDKLRVSGNESRVEVRFPDGSKVVSGRETVWTWGVLTPMRQEIVLESGTLIADVQKQVPGSGYSFSTPEVRVMVLGTRFRLAAERSVSTLDLFEGNVRIRRHTDGREMDLAAGSRAVAYRDMRQPFVSTPIPGFVATAQTPPKPAENVPQTPAVNNAQTPTSKALLVTAAPIPAFAHDAALKRVLEAAGFQVREVSFNRITAMEAQEVDLIVVPSHKCANTRALRDVSVAVIAWHNVWHQDLGLMDYESTSDNKLVVRPVAWAGTPPPIFAPLVRSTQPEFELNIYSSLPDLDNSIAVLNLPYSPGRNPLVLIPKNPTTKAGPRVAFCIDIREGSGKGSRVEFSEELFTATVRWCQSQRAVGK